MVVLNKLCIYGGTFDPVHIGHLLLAKYIKEEIGADKLMFVPAFLPPHKTHKSFTSFEHRYNMLKKSIENHPDFLLSDIEFQRQGTSYSYITINEIREQYQLSKENLFFLIGGDSLVDFHKWRKPEEILNSSQVIVMARPGSDFHSVNQKIMGKVKILNTPLMEISSTDIRSRVKAGKSVDFMVTDAVKEYIQTQHLYQ